MPLLSQPASPLPAVAMKVFGSQFFPSVWMVCHFSRAADEVMCILSGEINRHIPQLDRNSELE